MDANESAQPEAAEDTETPEAPEAPEAAVEEAPEVEQTQVDALDPEAVAALQRDRDTLYERVQRLSAEFDNFQKRTKREKAKWSQDTLRDVLGGLLPVLDNLDYAVKAFEGEIKDPASLKQGVVLVREELHRTLGNHGVARLDVEEGAPFDPDRHNAIAMQEVEGVEQAQIMFQARPGYTIGDLVLRPAEVGVAKPKA